MNSIRETEEKIWQNVWYNSAWTDRNSSRMQKYIGTYTTRTSIPFNKVASEIVMLASQTLKEAQS